MKLLKSIWVTFLAVSQRFRTDPKRCCPKKGKSEATLNKTPLCHEIAPRFFFARAKTQQIKTRYVTFSRWLLTCYTRSYYVNFFSPSILYILCHYYFILCHYYFNYLFQSFWPIMSYYVKFSKIAIISIISILLFQLFFFA